MTILPRLNDRTDRTTRNYVHLISVITLFRRGIGRDTRLAAYVSVDDSSPTKPTASYLFKQRLVNARSPQPPATKCQVKWLKRDRATSGTKLQRVLSRATIMQVVYAFLRGCAAFSLSSSLFRLAPSHPPHSFPVSLSLPLCRSLFSNTHDGSKSSVSVFSEAREAGEGGRHKCVISFLLRKQPRNTRPALAPRPRTSAIRALLPRPLRVTAFPRESPGDEVAFNASNATMAPRHNSRTISLFLSLSRHLEVSYNVTTTTE